MYKRPVFFSPRETTTFFLRILLISFWIGLDALAILVAEASLPPHGILSFIVVTILMFGTVFSTLLIWATGSLFKVAVALPVSGSLMAHLHSIKTKPGRLIIAGMASAALASIFVGTCTMLARAEGGTGWRTVSASDEIAQKCAEIARLEQAILRSDARKTMTECLVQYDAKFATLRDIDVPGRQ